MFISKEILLALKKKEALSFGKIWTNSENIVLSKITETDNDKVPVIGRH